MKRKRHRQRSKATLIKKKYSITKQYRCLSTHLNREKLGKAETEAAKYKTHNKQLERQLEDLKNSNLNLSQELNSANKSQINQLNSMYEKMLSQSFVSPKAKTEEKGILTEKIEESLSIDQIPIMQEYVQEPEVVEIKQVEEVVHQKPVIKTQTVFTGNSKNKLDYEFTQAMRKYADDSKINLHIEKVGNGFYKVNGIKIYVLIERGKIITRVGGGFMALQEFVTVYLRTHGNQFQSVKAMSSLMKSTSIINNTRPISERSSQPHPLKASSSLMRSSDFSLSQRKSSLVFPSHQIKPKDNEMKSPLFASLRLPMKNSSSQKDFQMKSERKSIPLTSPRKHEVKLVKIDLK